MTECVESELKSLYAEATDSGIRRKVHRTSARQSRWPLWVSWRAGTGPCSDIDLVLIHNGKINQINSLAEKIWYPLWDARIRIDHSVRTPAECATSPAAS